jgi:cysteine-rich repeat protein
VTQALCGNGQKAASEACDDNNTDSGDGCSNLCAIEANFRCVTLPGQATVCTSYLNYVLSLADKNTVGTPGHGVVSNAESDSLTWIILGALDKPYTDVKEFDMNTDGIVDGIDIVIIFDQLDILAPVCGDDNRTGPEQCDDGNEASSDGCSATCTVEAGYTCDTASPNVCRLSQ